MLRGLFITGTDTGVGKTRVSALILRALRADGFRVAAYKPACSGAIRGPDGLPVWEDVEELYAASGGEYGRDQICPQRFLAPLAPPAAAAAEGRLVDEELTRRAARAFPDSVDMLVVEGAGGWLCPLGERTTMADLAIDLGHPVIIVAANRLGMISHTLLTLESVRSRGGRVAGVVLNDLVPGLDSSAETNMEVLARYADIPLLGRLAFQGGAVIARGRALTGVNWRVLASDDRSAPVPSAQ